MKKTNKKTVLINKDAVKNRIDLIRVAQLPFTLRYTTYTVELICEKLNFDYLFLTRFQSKRLFLANSLIKRDIVNSKIEYPDLTYCDVSFFLQDIERTDQYFDIINIDLSNAYAQVLFIYGFITEDTYNFLLKIPKLDRLAAVGMLASQKRVFNYDKDGEIIFYDKVKAKDKLGRETQGIFIFCIKIVGDLMIELARILKDDFLFFWVDGIYFKKTDKINTLFEKITESGFKFKTKNIPCFKSSLKENEKIKIELWEDCGTFSTKKEFNFPKKDTEFSKSLTKYLQTNLLK